MRIHFTNNEARLSRNSSISNLCFRRTDWSHKKLPFIDSCGQQFSRPGWFSKKQIHSTLTFLYFCWIKHSIIHSICDQLYRGKLGDGTMVAIRNLKVRKKCNIQSLTRQIELISKLRHPNLVKPIGHCFDCQQDDSAIIHGLFLVFEFVPNGTLRASIASLYLTL